MKNMLYLYQKKKENKKMIIYVGYIISDYAHALFMSTDRKKVKAELAKIPTHDTTYIVGYILKGNELIELDCD